MLQVFLLGYLKGVLLNMVMILVLSLGCALGVSLEQETPKHQDHVGLPSSIEVLMSI
jgi:hypothetical protein